MRRTLPHLFMVLAFAIGSGCSSDPDSPLGSGFLDDGLITSEPGSVFVDTVAITAGDTSFVTTAFLSKPVTMTLGRRNDIESAMIIRYDFSGAGADTLKTVTKAEVRVVVTSGIPEDTLTLSAQFFELLAPVDENDTLTSLNLAATAIPDEGLINVDRQMKLATSRYSIPTSLAQDWIRGNQPHDGFAIVISDTTAARELFFGTKQSASDKPFLAVEFSDATTTNYGLLADGTLVKDLSTTSNLRLSDGVTRRIFFPVDLSAIDPKSLIHDAKLVVNFVPSSSTGGSGEVELYAPTDSVITSSGILSGTGVTATILSPSLGQAIFSVRGIITRFVSDPTSDNWLVNNGLVMRYLAEGTSTRRVDFYGSAAADSLKPFLYFTFSEAPTFAR